jgi:uncharacterized protein YndB with AHSA1/START domain
MGTIILIILVLIAALLAYAATRPDNLHVGRSARIEAPPEKVFPLINDFRQWQSWSPWERLDPTMRRSFSGPEAGKGAVYEWEGNKKVGAGRMEMIDSFAPSKALIKLDFIKPFEGHYMTEFTVEPEAKGSNVKWEMHGPNSYMSKLMGVFMNMEKMIARDYDKGLAAMKAVAEGAAPPAVPPPR